MTETLQKTIPDQYSHDRSAVMIQLDPIITECLQILTRMPAPQLKAVQRPGQGRELYPPPSRNCHIIRQLHS